MANPIHQFEISPIIPIQMGGFDLSYTNSSLWMTIGVVASIALFAMATKKTALVPSRLQAFSEIAYEFVANMIRDNIGSGGKKYFPIVFTLFTVVLAGNILGLIPFSFTYTSHLIVTAALAFLVFFMVMVLGFAKHGTHFFSIFLPPGVPWWLTPLIVPIEMISFFIRPITLSVRLFANMVAGHIMLKVFAGFCVAFATMGGLGLLATALPVLFNSVLIGFELLIAFLQAYVFAVLSCIYLKDTVELDH